jgi:ATP-dependent Clp protease protease subunit
MAFLQGSDAEVKMVGEEAQGQPASMNDALLSQYMADFTKRRFIFLNQEVDDNIALRIMMSLLAFNDANSYDPIHLYINSPGGSVSAGLTIIDTMRRIKAPVYTVCYGLAASMAAIILICGEKGHRACTEHGLVMVHQPSGSYQGFMRQSDLEIQYKQITNTRNILEKIISEQTGIPVEEAHKLCQEDNYMDAAEAKKSGLIDTVILPVATEDDLGGTPDAQ